MRAPKILVVDDEPRLAKMLSGLLELEGFLVEAAADGAEALQRLGAFAPDVVVSDIRMPGLDGLELLRETLARSPETDVILMTAHASAESAVAALKAGAQDYLLKPFDNDELLHRIRRIVESRGLARENEVLRARLTPATLEQVVASSDAMLDVLELAKKVAGTDATVLLMGESGTGKEVVAECIHQASARAGGPLVRINCGALPELLLESELFGHEKGAFTGAHVRRSGLFEAADGGTLFLDEVGEMSPSLQVKLLRVLQARAFHRVGGVIDVAVDVRVVAATNRDLEGAMAEGTFREDLFYRLSVFPIELPPLRVRRPDILPLAERFFVSHGRSLRDTSPGVQERLESHGWPGNVRELENVVERACILAQGEEIGERHLPERLGESPSPSPVIEIPDEGIELRIVERDLIYQALEKAEGNKSRAAKLLGITRRTLYSKLEKYGDP